MRNDLIENRPDHRGLNSREPDPGFFTRPFPLVFGRFRTLAICSQLSKCFVEPFVCHFGLSSIKNCARPAACNHQAMVSDHSLVQERSPFRKWPFSPAATKSTCRDGLRWRKTDSNPQSPPEEGPTSSRCSTFPALPFREGPRVRIRLPPAGSQLRTCSSWRNSALRSNVELRRA